MKNRNIFIAFLFGGISITAWIAALAMSPGTLQINQFAGLNSDDSPLSLVGGQTPDSQNIQTDAGPGIQGRNGYVSFSTQTSNNLWEFPNSNGTRYLITQSSNTLKASTGGSSFTIKISTVAFNVTTVGAVLGDKFFFANTTDGLKYWDGASVSVVDKTLKFNQLATCYSRLWGAGVPTAARTLYGSKLNDGTSFTLVTNPAVSDPTQIVLGGALDEVITALYSSFQGKLVWFKAHSFGALLGFDRSDFNSRVYSDRVGTSYPDCIRDCDGVLRWLGPARSIWEFDGSVLYSISNDSAKHKRISTLLGTLVQGDGSSKAFTQTTQSDWQAGTLGAGLSATNSPGDVGFSTGTKIDDFSDGDYSASPAWTFQSAGSGHPAFQVIGGVLVSTASASATGSASLYTSNTLSTASWRFSFSGSGGANVFSFNICNTIPINDGSNGCYQFYISTSGTLNYFRILKNSSSLATKTSASNVFNGAQHIIEASRDNSSLLSLLVDTVVVATVTDTSYKSFPYIQIFTKPNASRSVTYNFDDFYIHSLKSAFQSKSLNIGSTIASWGSFSATTLNNGGSHTFAIYVDTNSTININKATTFTSSQTITSGSIPTVPVGKWVTVVDVLARTSSSQFPTLSDFTINWVDSTLLRIPSAYYNQRYWLGVAVSSAANNRNLIYDRDSEWQFYSGMNMASMAIYNSNLYFGNTNGIWKAETGYTDNGSPIVSYFVTKTYAPSGLELYSTFHDLWVTTENSDSTLGTIFYTDGNSSGHSLASIVMNIGGGQQNRKLPFPFSQIQQGKYINFKWSVTSSSAWRLLQGDLEYVPDRVPTGG